MNIWVPSILGNFLTEGLYDFKNVSALCVRKFRCFLYVTANTAIFRICTCSYIDERHVEQNNEKMCLKERIFAFTGTCAHTKAYVILRNMNKM